MNKRFISFALAYVLSANMLSFPAYASYDGTTVSSGITSFASRGTVANTDAPAITETANFGSGYGDDGIDSHTGLENPAYNDGEAETADDLALVTSFSDVKPGQWFYSDVMNCAKLGIVAGFSDGKFKPNDTVTYAQYVVMLSRTFYNSDVEKVTDTAGKPWYYANMKAMNDKDLLSGTAITNKGGWPTVIAANDSVTRYDMAQIAACVISNNGKSATTEAKNAVPGKLADWAQIEKDRPTKAWRTGVTTCVATGVITGMSDGTFSGNASMTRAQACTVMMRMLKLINNYNPGDADNNQYDDGKSQDTGSSQTQTGKTLANGQAITEANVKSIIDQVRREYPTGTVWGDPATVAGTKSYKAGSTSTDVLAVYGKIQSNKGGYTSSVYGCGGFAAMVSDRIFGQSGAPARQVTDVSKVRVGDIVIQRNDAGQLTHVAVVTEILPTTGLDGITRPTYKVSDGNYPENGTRIVKWSQDKNGKGSATMGTDLVFTRYPD